MHPYLRLRAKVTAVDVAAAPVIEARIVRRIVGKALIDTHCPYGRPLCQPMRRRASTAPAHKLCNLADSCPYGVLFAASMNGRPPFAIHVAPGDQANEPIIEVTLLGSAWRTYPWFLAGLQRALQRGVGRERTRWQVTGVKRIRPDQRSDTICNGDMRSLKPRLEPDQLSMTSRRYIEPRPVSVDLLSPTRLIDDGHLLMDGSPVPLRLLVARILDRFQGVYGEQASDLLRPNVRDTIETEAQKVGLLDHGTRWIEVNDYSARQRREMALGGKIGRMTYSREAARFLPILRAGEILHVGKNPTSGCGRMRVSTVE
jgi:hypothetical protein